MTMSNKEEKFQHKLVKNLPKNIKSNIWSPVQKMMKVFQISS